MKIVNNPHDKLIRELLKDKEKSKDFLTNSLPKHILKNVDLNSLEIKKDSFVDEGLKEYFSDILYKVSLSGSSGYLYFLFEHKSYNDRLTAFQVLKYMVKIWELSLKQDKKEKFPIIIPLVIYHGKEKWSAGVRFSKILGEVPEELLTYIPDFEFILTDLSEYKDDDLKRFADLKIGLLLLKYVFRKEFREKFGSIFSLFKELKDKESGLEYLHAVIKYIMTTAEDVDTNELKQLIENNISKEIGENVMTIAEQLMQEGIIKGRQEGEQKGMQEGMQEGMQKGMQKEAKESVLKVLEARFNLVPNNIKSQVISINDVKILEQLLKEAATVADLSTFTKILSETDINRH